MSKNVTMDTIAKELFVSKSLVSRALSDTYGVSDEMRNKIKLTAMRMGYTFGSHRPKEARRTDNITVIIDQRNLNDSGYWVKIINGVQAQLNRKGKSMFLSGIQNDDGEDLPSSITQMKSDGIILMGTIKMPFILAIQSFNLPVVMVDPLYNNLKYDTIMANNYQGAYDACEHLLKQGHKVIGFVGSEVYSYSFKERIRGFTACMDEQENAGSTKVFCTDSFDEFLVPFSRKQFTQMMHSTTRPSALLCANDITAIHAYDLLNKMEIKIPESVSLMGFDDIPKSEYLAPPLSTVHIPKTAMGERAADMILRRIDDPQPPRETVLINTHIVLRDSERVVSDYVDKMS